MQHPRCLSILPERDDGSHVHRTQQEPRAKPQSLSQVRGFTPLLHARSRARARAAAIPIAELAVRDAHVVSRRTSSTDVTHDRCSECTSGTVM